MQRDIDNYRRGLISFPELCLIALAEGFVIHREDDGISAIPAR